MVALAVGFAVALLFGALRGGPVLSVVGVAIAAYLVVGSFVEVYGRIAGRGVTLGVAISRAMGLPRSAWGTAFAHAGIGVTLFGLAATGWGVELVKAIKPGDQIALGPYQLEVGETVKRPGPNFEATVAPMEIRSGGAVVATIDPARRFYPARQTPTTEAGIATLGLGQFYVSLSEQNPDGSLDARLYWKPWVALIWIGALLMALGGGLSLSDRRLRIGVARRARRPAAQPAE
jgi:cytochrome c-type biogenesis protein CcmF